MNNLEQKLIRLKDKVEVIEKLLDQIEELHKQQLSCDGHIFVPVFSGGNGGMDVCFEKCMTCGLIHSY